MSFQRSWSKFLAISFLDWTLGAYFSYYNCRPGSQCLSKYTYTHPCVYIIQKNTRTDLSAGSFLSKYRSILCSQDEEWVLLFLICTPCMSYISGIFIRYRNPSNKTDMLYSYISFVSDSLHHQIYRRMFCHFGVCDLHLFSLPEII